MFKTAVYIFFLAVLSSSCYADTEILSEKIKSATGLYAPRYVGSAYDAYNGAPHLGIEPDLEKARDDLIFHCYFAETSQEDLVAIKNMPNVNPEFTTLFQDSCEWVHEIQQNSGDELYKLYKNNSGSKKQALFFMALRAGSEEAREEHEIRIEEIMRKY